MEKLIKRGVVSLFFAAFVSIVILTVVGLLYPKKYIGLGAWGDFFGGVANPLLTFLAFAAVLVTVWLQHEELGLSRKELSRSANALEKQIESIRKQNFENTFFQMLTIHNNIVNSIDLVSTGKPNQYGRDCFSTFYTRLTKLLRDEQTKKTIGAANMLPRAYQNFWKDHQPELGHYYRYLYRFVLFIKEKDDDADFYMNLLRAQLSDQELLLLFYNALSPSGAPFKLLIEEWALLDNMPRIKLLEQAHYNFFEFTAYDSNGARHSRKMNREKLEKPS
jgi:Putative phage abortive infection protein